MVGESKKNEREIKLAIKQEQLYFFLLLLSTIMTSCVIIVGIFVLGMAGVTVIGIITFLLSLLWIRKWIWIMKIRTEGIFLSMKQLPDWYSLICKDAEKMGLGKMPEIILTRNRLITRPRTVGFFQKYMIVIPADYNTDETIRFEILRELAHVKHNHEEKQTALLLGSWIPFLRSTYIRSCEETADRLALNQLNETDRIPVLVRSIVGPSLWKQIDLSVYIEEKQQRQPFAVTLSELIRHQPSVHQRLKWAGQETSSLRHMRFVSSLFVVLSCTAVIALILFGTKLEPTDWMTSWMKPVEQKVSSQEDLGETKLMAAIQKGSLDEIEQLIPKSDLEAVDADGDTALHYLGYRKSSEGLEDVFKNLLQAGADEDAINEFGERPFITAVYSNNKELVELYLKHGEAINQQDDEKYTPLHHAVEGEGKQTVKLLLEKGADPALKNADGYTPLMMAEEYELDDIIFLLKQKQTQTL